jgi:hypothetical protein
LGFGFEFLIDVFDLFLDFLLYYEFLLLRQLRLRIIVCAYLALPLLLYHLLLLLLLLEFAFFLLLFGLGLGFSFFLVLLGFLLGYSFLLSLLLLQSLLFFF